MERATNMVRDLESAKKKRRIVPTLVSTAVSTTVESSEQPSLPRSANAINPSLRDEVTIHNRFELKRRFSDSDTDKILDKARDFMDASPFRFVHFGAEDGYLLVRAREAWKNLDVVYIGVEGGTKVGGPSTFIESAQDHEFIHGMQDETLFEEVEENKHAAITQDSERKTVALLYDGGILAKQPIDAIVGVVQHFVPGSVVIFVTENGSMGSREQADSEYITGQMRRHEWALIDRYPVKETNDASEPTMQALFFRKPPESV
jgi:hypothetical protein